MVELARRGYAYGRDHPSSNALMGYFPEFLRVDPGAYGNTTEICEVADMIYLALRQTKAGAADCWDDIDRWVRNIFTEAQLLETDWAYEYSEKHGVPMEREYSVREGVPDRWLGAWGGWIAANDWQGNARGSVAPCCHPNAAMQLYRVWRDMIEYEERSNRLSIHLLLNRASPWADVDSHIPYSGLVEVRLKTDCELALRAPEWGLSQECECRLNGVDAEATSEGRYVIARAANGDVVSFRWPLTERCERLHIIDKDYDVVVRGNEIVDIDPPGEHYPIFGKPHYRTGETRWHTLERFVADRVVADY
jgi:hypothetical protein